jgi:hypothetical protein
MADDGLDFNGWIKPPEVPPDPVGDDWRGAPGPTGPTGPTGPPGPTGPAGGLPLHGVSLPTSTGTPADLASKGIITGDLYLNGGIVCVAP